MKQLLRSSLAALASTLIVLSAFALSRGEAVPPATAQVTQQGSLERKLRQDPRPMGGSLFPATDFESLRPSAESDAQRNFSLLPKLPPTSTGKVKTFFLFAEVKAWEVAPGINEQAWTYNGTVPGPTIHVRQGDRVRVVLINNLPEPTTIHWHGLTVDADMDGVPGMSQRAVPPGQSFVYEFTASDPGTYIYHTHYNDLYQLDHGLYGAVVVDDAKPPQHYDRDYLMLISSWRIQSDTENYFSINGKSYPLTKPYPVKSGDRVRIREIDISGTEFHTMHLHGHRFQVVAVDGQTVAPQNRQSMVTLSLGPGETRDIAFVANAKPGTWMVHCHVLDHLMNGPVGPGGLMTSVQYENAPDNTGLTATGNVMNMSASGGGGQSGGPPMNQTTVYILGAVAGLTIFFGLPFAALKRVSRRGIALFNAIAVGVLFFLLFDILRQATEPIGEALRRVQLGAPRIEFWGLLAVYLCGFGVGLLSLVFFSRSFMKKDPLGAINPMSLATMIAAGIGLHNFSEGLAIGQSAATGAIQLAMLLIIGFGLHNMTEGFGIAAPLAGSGGVNLSTIVRLGLIGGAPTFLGTVTGYHFVSPVLSVLFLTLAAGAIIYVINEMTNVGAKIGFKTLATVGVFIGFAVGLGTDLILTAAGA
jgi:FtsP/CotA-like multicopper oxidase with cupredoxin domain/zinc transporter ZupT